MGLNNGVFIGDLAGEGALRHPFFLGDVELSIGGGQLAFLLGWGDG
jgi:hypothetical protein